jgi:hypothetical protein
MSTMSTPVPWRAITRHSGSSAITRSLIVAYWATTAAAASLDT